MEIFKRVDETIREKRLDKVLASLFPEISRRKLRNLIGQGAVYLNGKRCLISSKMVCPKDTIKLVLKERRETKDFKEIETIYDSEDFIAINKPPFLSTVPNRGEIFSAQYMVSKLKKIDLKQIHPVNRLDSPVSGVILFSINENATKHIEKLKMENKIEKIYYAIVRGELKEDKGIIKTPLYVSSDLTFPTNKGKESITMYEVIKNNENFYLLRVIPITGRRHQIRAHLKSIGAPIVGDRKYGEKPYLSQRPLLHCKNIKFVGLKGELIDIEGKFFTDFQEFEEKLLG